MATSHDGEEVELTMKFESLLFFITGAPREAPLKFDPLPSVSFQHSSLYPHSNTCSNTIFLPAMDTSFGNFLYYMTSGIRSTLGFGLV